MIIINYILIYTFNKRLLSISLFICLLSFHLHGSIIEIFGMVVLNGKDKQTIGWKPLLKQYHLDLKSYYGGWSILWWGDIFPLVLQVIAFLYRDILCHFCYVAKLKQQLYKNTTVRFVFLNFWHSRFVWHIFYGIFLLQFVLHISERLLLEEQINN